MPLPGVEPAARFWVGLSTPEALDAGQIDRLAAVAADAARVLTAELSADRQRERLERLEQAADLIPALLRVLDVREVIDRLSTTARRALPHDLLLLNLFSDDLSTFTVYARSDRGAGEGIVRPNVYPASTIHAWTFSIVDDHTLHPMERDSPATKIGARSSLRFPVRFDDRVIGGVTFVSFTPRAYSDADVPIGHRLSEHVASAISHFRLAGQLAEEARRAGELRAQAANLELLDASLAALTDASDVRDVFGRISQVAQKVVAHDAALLMVLVGDGTRARLYAGTAFPQAAATDATVLLLGESGTGKEVIARFVHRASKRSRGPFIALNCAALPEQLLEAELFGYERGAFTGATQSKPGQLEQASGGTLFLDEVGEMSLPAQAKFLRVLQEKEFQRLGGTRVLRTDARIVAATNRDLLKAIGTNQFREDLFYRLNVFAIRLPPLRERRDDIMPLTQAFLTEFGRAFANPPAGISREAKQMLLAYHWPGNIRELRNILERASILCDGGLITDAHLALPVAGAAPAPAPVVTAHSTPSEAPARTSAGPPAPADEMPRDLQSIERTMIERALENARFNKSKAAKELGLTRHQLYIRMKRHGLSD